MWLNKPWINNSATVYTKCIYLRYWPGCLQGLPLYRQSALYQTWESIVLGSSSEWSGSLSERDPVLEPADRDVRSQVHWSAASFDMCSVQSARILSPPTSVLLLSAQCQNGSNWRCRLVPGRYQALYSSGLPTTFSGLVLSFSESSYTFLYFAVFWGSHNPLHAVLKVKCMDHFFSVEHANFNALFLNVKLKHYKMQQSVAW